MEVRFAHFTPQNGKMLILIDCYKSEYCNTQDNYEKYKEMYSKPQLNHQAENPKKYASNLWENET